MSSDGSRRNSPTHDALSSTPAAPRGQGAALEHASPWPHVEVRGQFSIARKEWLHTNGAGAYASSTIAGMHTRRYHGLLVAALDPPRRRHVMLSHVDVCVRPVRQQGAPFERRASWPRWDLAKHQFPGIDPESSSFYLERFDQDPLPRWAYAVPGGELEVTLGLVRGENAAVLRYAWSGADPVMLTLRPLLAARHIHQLLRENGGISQKVELRAGAARGEPGSGRDRPVMGEVRVQPNRALPRICFRYQGTFVGSQDWWRRFEYLGEQDRGLDFLEDLWTPGHFETVIGAEPVHLLVAVGALPDDEPENLLAAASAAIRAEDPGPRRPLLERKLSIAAEAFRADAAARPSVIAGYPWFEVWGRDALISLPGLYLVPRKTEAAIRVLRAMIDAMQDGLVPNRLPDAGEPADFHAADATLWLFEAARLLADVVGDTHPFVAGELLGALRDAFESAVRGTRNGIHVTADGLFAAGRLGEGAVDGLTWMDARVAGRAVTPRAGCPVELTALWAKGSETLARLARAAGDARLAGRAEAAASAARRGFAARFWCEATGYPYDVISEHAAGEGAFRDASIRPNALIAVAVDPACFTPERAASLLDRVRLELVTPAGVRTLSPADPAYAPRYQGGPEARDSAYHQGTAWPFLLGFYARAARRFSTLGEHVIPLLHRLAASAAANEIALGQVPEVASGEPPHHPGGSFAQAFSVAELLRLIAWDLPAQDPGSAAGAPPR
ncbi:amylo-alpha-1,6-glucosidase [Sorangium sp. So ce448]|uniref:amylo-alpha-1,6-glucosidase n=1 Tax=Sorangium sp. So ce448 TaxID=3133314 RepID=UPI003F633951